MKTIARLRPDVLVALIVSPPTLLTLLGFVLVAPVILDLMPDFEVFPESISCSGEPSLDDINPSSWPSGDRDILELLKLQETLVDHREVVSFPEKLLDVVFPAFEHDLDAYDAKVRKMELDFEVFLDSDVYGGNRCAACSVRHFQKTFRENVHEDESASWSNLRSMG